MTALYDEEEMIKDAERLFKAKLNDEIDCINTAKKAIAGDPLYLDHIPADKYWFETLNKGTNNYRGFFVIYGLVDTPPTQSQEDNFVEEVSMTFQIGTFDKGERVSSNTLYKLLRYRKALKQVIMKNRDVFRGYARPLIGSLRPDAFPYDNKYIILAAGIDITASVTAR